MSESLAANEATPSPVMEYAPAGESLRRQAVRNSLWTISSFAMANVIRLAGNLVITHLLAPQWIGVMALVTTMVIGIRFFSDVGIGPAVIANPRGNDEKFLRTAYAIQIFRGFMIWLAVCAISIPAAWYYSTRQDPIYSILSLVMPVAGFQAVFEGFRSTAIFRLQRMLDLRKGAVLDVTEIFITTAVMITWAWIHPTVWALVIPGLVGCASVTVISHFLLRDRTDRPQWHSDCARELLRVGRWIFLSTALTFLSNQFATLIFGRLIDPVTLGIYSIAMNLATMPFTAIARLGGSVLFPTFSKVADTPARFTDVYERARTVLHLAGGMIVCGLIATSPFGIRVLYNSAYDSGGLMLQLLSLSIWFQILDSTNVAGLLARQHAGWMVSGNLTKVICMFGLVPAVYFVFGRRGGEMYGFCAALLALGFADVARVAVGTIGLTRNGLPWRAFRIDVLVTPLILVVGLISYLIAAWAAPGVEAHFPATRVGRRLANLVLLSIAATPVLAVFVPLVASVWKKSKRAAIRNDA